MRPRPRIEGWPRGGGKSTTAELGCVRLGSNKTRRFVLYVSETQPQADRHVQSIATMLETIGMERAVNEYGASKGWRHSELRAANGFNVVALGLDAAIRGVKLDQIRPDMIVLDDIDNRHDTASRPGSPGTRQKKIEVLTDSILPSGSADCAILFVQNLITEQSIMAQVVNGSADFLHNREIGTVEPAVLDLQFERAFTDEGARYIVTGGTPTWQGQDLAIVESQINTWGLGAFMREAQHDTQEASGGLWEMDRDIEPFRITWCPPLVAIAVALDPSATATGDEAGIVAGGIDARGHGYLLDDASVQALPQVWAGAAVATYHKHGATALVAESNSGGEMVRVTIGTVEDAPSVELLHASRGKETRAEPVQKLSQDGKIHHVGYFPQLERELCTWKQGMASPNRLDAFVWLFTKLMLGLQPGAPAAAATASAVSQYQQMARRQWPRGMGFRT